MTQAAKPGLLTKLAYGFGSIAYGVKDNGFAYFLLLFYSQVLGLNAQMVGLALTIALVVDAVSDPIVGYWSDNLRTKWGRRHPFMYAAALPVAIAYYFVWNPPLEASPQVLWFYLLFIAILVRTLITFYEVPSSSLVAELTDDYDGRTSFLAFRSFFGWVGGVTLSVIALGFFLVPKPGVENGYFNIEGYEQFGLLSAVMIFASIMVCALGTHKQIPHLRSPPVREKITLGLMFRELFETLSERSLFPLLAATLFGYVASGLSASLNHYLNGFFWEFTTQQVAAITLSIYISAPLALVLAPIFGKLWGKKHAAIGIGAVAFTLAPAPYFLRLAGLMPENGDPMLFYVMMGVVIIDVALIIAVQILAASMLADVVEQSELKTGRRSEGVFFASISFTRKCVAGLGIMMASTILALAQFPTKAVPGQVPEETIRLLGAIYAPTMLGIWTLMILSLFFYTINRDSHKKTLEALAARRAAEAGAD